MLDKKLLDILCRPKSKGELHYDESNQKLICESIRLKYPVRDDIPVMLIIDEAEKYNVSTDA